MCEKECINFFPTGVRIVNGGGLGETMLDHWCLGTNLEGLAIIMPIGKSEIISPTQVAG